MAWVSLYADKMYKEVSAPAKRYQANQRDLEISGFNDKAWSVEFSGTPSVALFKDRHYLGDFIFIEGWKQIRQPIQPYLPRNIEVVGECPNLQSIWERGKYRNFAGQICSLIIQPLVVKLNVIIIARRAYNWDAMLPDMENAIDRREVRIHVARANAVFSRYKVKFKVADFKTLLKSDYWAIDNVERRSMLLDATGIRRKDCINVYYVKDVASDTEEDYGGWATFLWNTGLTHGIVVNSSSCTHNTLAHELGHYLGLKHTTWGDEGMNERNLMLHDTFRAHGQVRGRWPILNITMWQGHEVLRTLINHGKRKHLYLDP